MPGHWLRRAAILTAPVGPQFNGFTGSGFLAFRAINEPLQFRGVLAHVVASDSQALWHCRD